MSYNYVFKSESRLESKRVAHALEYARMQHKGQYRRGGDEYIVHPMSVADNIRYFIGSCSNNENYDIESLLMAAYLHDTIEDTEATYKDLEYNFGPKVASIVLELTTDEEEKKRVGKTRYLSKKMKNMSSEALIIKLCDRLDNTADLLDRDEAWRKKYTKETYSILCYIIQNRNLNLVHLKIINCIMEQLNRVRTSDINLMYYRRTANGLVQ